jgi:hypothetical protein
MLPKSNRYVLAIDLGSGGPKVGVVDEQGEVLASAAERTTTTFCRAAALSKTPTNGGMPSPSPPKTPSKRAANLLSASRRSLAPASGR